MERTHKTQKIEKIENIEKIEMTKEELIVFLDLQPLPNEGGFYRETYRSPDRLNKESLPARYSGARAVNTCIYYLVTADSFSAFHRLASDEIYHYYLGSVADLFLIYPDGSLTTVTIGRDVYAGEQLQVVVPAGVWQALRVREGGDFTLVGCTVSPGFEFDDYEHGNWESLLRQFPDHHAEIMKLTRK
ncbi:MAG TPA: cupin domain-containing protein [Chroococcales cyanobacterium]